MKTSIAPTSHTLRLLTMWLAAMLLFVAPALSQTTPVGGTARPFTVTNLATGQPIQMADFAGKVLVLDFFAYWCGPCQSSSPDLETNVQRYYAARGGNANGVPVQCLAVSIDDSNPALTNEFIENAGLELAGEDPMTSSGAWRQFNEAGSIPLFAIINCVEGSPSHGQWELLYKRAGYAGAPALRAVIDQVMPADADAEIAVVAPGGGSLTSNGPGVDLGDIMVGASGSEQTFTIRNTGDNNLTGIAVTKDGANANDFTLDTSRTATLLTGDATTTFKVTFTPSEVGSRSAVLRIASNDSDENPFLIRLDGTGTAVPELEVRSGPTVLLPDSAEISFRNTLVGETGEERTVVISNMGNAPLTGVSMSLRGLNLMDFELIGTPAPIIAPGESSSVIVRFLPTINGPLVASLRIESNDADENPFDIRLSGTATGSNEPVAILEVRNGTTPLVYGSAVISFGSGPIDEAIIERTIVISNLGNAPLTRLYPSLGGTHASDFKIIGTPPQSIDTGASATFTVQFTPTASGVRKSTLRITSSDPNQNPFDIEVTGTGEGLTSGPEISVTQGNSTRKNLVDGKSLRNLGTSRVGKRGKVMTFKVTNTGTSDLKMLKAKFVGQNQKDFVIVKGLTKKPLAPGKSTTFTIALKPSTSGARKTTLQIMSNDSDESPFAVKLVGRGK